MAEQIREEILEADRASAILQNLQFSSLQVLGYIGQPSNNSLHGWFVTAKMDQYQFEVYMEGKNIISLEYLSMANEIIFQNKVSVISALPKNTIFALEDAICKAAFPAVPNL